MSPEFWTGKRVFVTGHTGFKGAWLSFLLARLGAVVRGFSLAPPTNPNLFELARLAELVEDRRGDVRDEENVLEEVREFRPDAVVHLAAQSLVRRSYVAPEETFSTNVLGTVHVLGAARRVDSVRAVFVVTSDKCYENRDEGRPFREGDPLGGEDPYSASKAAAELVAGSYRASFGSERWLVASARAGNVIGGGDFAEDRLLPDLVRAFSRGEPAVIRSPRSTRPFQHVLEPLVGYLALVERLLDGDRSCARPFNFGPRPEQVREVRQIVDVAMRAWGTGAASVVDEGKHPREARLLALDSSRAAEMLGIATKLEPEEAVRATVRFHRRLLEGADARELLGEEVEEFLGTRRGLAGSTVP